MIRAFSFFYLLFGTFAHAGESHDIIGDWESVEIRCIGMKEASPNITIAGIFNPHSHLHVELLQGASASGAPPLYRVSKAVTRQSCQNPAVVSDALLGSTFLASAQNLKRDAITNELRSVVLQGVELIDYKINRRALFECHPLVAALTFLQFPEYFNQEATRPYFVQFHGDDLLVYFRDTDVCSAGYARAIYRHPENP